MESTIFDHLHFLFDESTAYALLPRVVEIQRKYNPIRRVTQSTHLSEQDILLITYPDQVRESPETSIQTLTDFLGVHVQNLVSGIHILPFYPYSSDDGFAVMDYTLVDPTLGSWKDLDRLGHHFDLMFDLVLNHVSAKSKWFERFLADDPTYRDFFIVLDDDPDLSQVARPRTLPLLTAFQTPSGEKKVWTTFSADQIDLNYNTPKVLLAMIDTLLFYVQHGARFIRLDAIAYLWKEVGTSCIHLPQTHAIIRLFRAILDEVAPWVMLITETNVPHVDNIAYFGNGSDEAQLVYNFALPPLVLHAFRTGNASILSRWVQTLTLPSDQVAFFNFLASHDGIGVNPVRGILNDAEIDDLVTLTQEHGGLVSYKQNRDGSAIPYELNINYFDALSNPNNHAESMSTQVNRFITAQAIMLSLAGVPGIYFHSLFGSRGDRAAAETSGLSRRINRQKPTRDELERELAQPGSQRAQVFSRYSDLLRMRRTHRAFDPHADQHIVGWDERIFAVLRVASDQSERVLCLHNVANEVVSVHLGKNVDAESWKNLADSTTYTHDLNGVCSLTLLPYQTIWAMQQRVFGSNCNRGNENKERSNDQNEF